MYILLLIFAPHQLVSVASVQRTNQHIMMLLKQQQVPFQPASWRHVCFLLMSVIYLSCIPREVTPLFLTRGSASPASESIYIKEGETLSMNCSATVEHLQYVWWRKLVESKDTWLTGNAIVHTKDPRVSIATCSFDEYSTFYLQITDITTSDAGRYKCYAAWGDGNSLGYIDVSVQYFPAENPVCATNVSDRISTESIDVWCDTAIGNPAVTITWRVDNSDKEVTGSVYSEELPQNERMRSVVRLREHLQNQVLVCSVTSSTFAGQNRSCSIGPILYAGSPHTTSGIFVGGYIAAAVGVPVAFVVGLLVSLACTRKRQQTVKRRSNEPRRETATPVGEDQPPDMELMAIPYSVTTMRDETMTSASRDDDVTGARGPVQAYETRIGPAEEADNAAYEQVDRNIGENEVTSSYLDLQ